MTRSNVQSLVFQRPARARSDDGRVIGSESTRRGDSAPAAARVLGAVSGAARRHDCGADADWSEPTGPRRQAIGAIGVSQKLATKLTWGSHGWCFGLPAPFPSPPVSGQPAKGRRPAARLDASSRLASGSGPSGGSDTAVRTERPGCPSSLTTTTTDVSRGARVRPSASRPGRNNLLTSNI